jgi:hypothetical protein
MYFVCLVGEAAGKAPFGVAKKEDVSIISSQLGGKADSAASVMSDTRMVSDIDVNERIPMFVVYFKEIT